VAQWNKDAQSYDNQSTRHEVYMRSDQYGNIINETATSRSAFGESIAVSITPVVQLDGLYGLDSRKFESFDAFGGTVDSTGTLMRCQTGTAQYGYGVLRSRRAVRYRPGQGALTRFTAAFTQGTAGYTQRAGFFSQEQALQIGYNGTSFGILRQNEGKAHIEKLVVTGAASVASDVTITLNGVAYVVPISIDTASINAAEISEWFQINATAGWVVEHCDGIVNFLSTSIGVKAGTFSFSAGTTTATATIETIQTGVADVNNWTTQENWNIDTCLGDGPDNGNPSNILLDPTKLNVYQINFRWLGAGQITYSIEHPDNGEMIAIHKEHYVNTNTTLHLDNPSLKLGYVAASLGGTGTNVVVTGGSIMGAIEGLIETTNLPTSAAVSIAGSYTTGSLHHALTIHNRLVFDNKINTREVLLKEISAAFRTSPAGQPIEIFVFYNFDDLPSPSVYNVISSTESSVFYNNTVGTLTLGTNIPIYTFFSSGGESTNLDLEKLRIALPPNNKITVAFQSTDTVSRASVALTFIED
tara:strand:+ start:5534 stop:7117 length:1584 start_codon:yes stop_codon:yes gene_type:complete